jgi:hypothetical protein
MLLLLILFSTEYFPHKKRLSFKSSMYLLYVAVSDPNSRNIRDNTSDFNKSFIYDYITYVK